MTEFDTLPPHLQRLGRQLVAAANERCSSHGHQQQRWRRPSRRVAVGLGLIALAIPAAAIASIQLISTTQVAASLPQGTLALMGTDPRCAVVRANVEYRCDLASPPREDAAPQAGADATGRATERGLVMAVARRPDGKRVFIEESTVAALRREAAATHVTRLRILEKRGSLTKRPDGKVTVTADANAAAQAGNGRPMGSPGQTNWKGTVEETVDATKHVNGGCRALNDLGTEWECYIGEAAVQQRIISHGFLGQYASGPGVG